MAKRIDIEGIADRLDEIESRINAIEGRMDQLIEKAARRALALKYDRYGQPRSPYDASRRWRSR